MFRHTAFLLTACVLLTGGATAQVEPILWKKHNNDIMNTNSGFVGINVQPLAPLHSSGDFLLENGDILFADDNGTIRFPVSSGANSPMVELFASGTSNPNRMVLAHSPAFANWGLQYRDVGDEFHFLQNGTSLLNVDLGSFEVVSSGLTKLLGGLEIQSEASFTSQNDSLTFPPVTGASAPMIKLFASGTLNSNRMVLAHSSAYPDWGLEYRDVGDEFHFVAGGTSLMNVDLGGSFVGMGGNLIFDTDLNTIQFPPCSGASSAMIDMFTSGTANADRMVIAHSPAFANYGLLYADSTDEFRFLGNGSTAMTIELGSREVGIRTDNPTAAFQVGNSGDGTVAVANAWNIFSSRDYKKNIEQLTDSDCADALDKIVATPVFRFQYKDQADDAASRLGLIVEESPQEVLASEIQVDGEIKALDLGRYVSMLHAAVKAQQAEITALRSERELVRELLAEVAELRKGQ